MSGNNWQWCVLKRYEFVRALGERLRYAICRRLVGEKSWKRMLSMIVSWKLRGASLHRPALRAGRVRQLTRRQRSQPAVRTLCVPWGDQVLRGQRCADRWGRRARMVLLSA